MTTEQPAEPGRRISEESATVTGQFRVPGRRVAEPGRGRLSRVGVLGVVIPLLTVGALATVRPPEPPPGASAAVESPVQRTDLVCPADRVGADAVVIANAEAAGPVEVRVRSTTATVEVEGVEAFGANPSVRVRGTGEMAPGLAVARGDAEHGVLCQLPQPQQWFTGVGAGPEHASRLELVNPDGGPAVADVVLFGKDGPLEAPALRGIRVPGSGSVVLDLDSIVPTTSAMAMSVTVNRGRVASFVLDTHDPLGRARAASDWLAPQSTPASTLHLPGLGLRGGTRELVLANPTEVTTRVGIQFATADSEFSATGVDDVELGPGQVRSVPLTKALAKRSARGVRGLVLTADQPILGTLRTIDGTDVTFAPASEPITARSVAALPGAARTLVVTGVSENGRVRWRGLDASGDEVVSESSEVMPGRALQVELPREVEVLDLAVEQTSVHAAVESASPSRGAGRVTLPLVELRATIPVPQVRPALS